MDYEVQAKSDKLVPHHKNTMGLEDQTDDLMGRLLRLLEKMRDNLLGSGYVFDSPQSEQVFERPLPNVRRKIAEMEAYFGSFPYAVTSFYAIVGAVDFCGYTSKFEEFEYPDPLQITTFDYGYSCFLKYRAHEKEREWFAEGYGGFVFYLSADYYHKEGVSGGPEYCFALPCDSGNPMLRDTPEQDTFLEYFAQMLRFGGFSGYSAVGDELPPYYDDISILQEARNLSQRFTELAIAYKNPVQ